MSRRYGISAAHRASGTPEWERQIALIFPGHTLLSEIVLALIQHAIQLMNIQPLV